MCLKVFPAGPLCLVWGDASMLFIRPAPSSIETSDRLTAKRVGRSSSGASSIETSIKPFSYRKIMIRLVNFALLLSTVSLATSAFAQNLSTSIPTNVIPVPVTSPADGDVYSPCM
jgi:hypothetical protein